MDTEVQDAPPASSTGTDSAAASPAQGAPAVTPAATGAQAETTPPAKTELEEFQADVAKATGKDVTKATDEESDQSAAESKTDTETDATKTDEPAAEEKVEGEESEALSQAQETKAKLTERPEWQAATKIADKLGKAAGVEMRGIMRGLFKTQHDLNVQVEKAKPAVEFVQEVLQSVGGNEQGVANIRHLIKVNDSDPAKAVPMFEMLLADAKKRAGLVLQSPELLTESQKLDEAVKAGVMDQADADKRKAELLELQKARTGTERTQAQSAAEREREQRTQSEQATQKAVAEVNAAESNWVNAKLKADPDFIAVQSIHDAFAKQNALDFWSKHQRFPNPKESVELLEKSLKAAKAEAAKFRPKPKAVVPIGGGNGSSSEHRQQPTTEFEQFQADVESAKKRH